MKYIAMTNGMRRMRTLRRVIFSSAESAGVCPLVGGLTSDDMRSPSIRSGHGGGSNSCRVGGSVRVRYRVRWGGGQRITATHYDSGSVSPRVRGESTEYRDAATM